MNHHFFIRLCCICMLLGLWTAPTFAQPPGFADQVYVSGFDQAVGITFDANGRMYVWEKKGIVWIVENGVKDPTPLIDISEEVGNWRDFGLLGFALDPNFLSNGHFYLLYIVDRHHLLNFGTPSYNPNTNEYFDATIGRVTRYTANAANNYSTANLNSRQVLLGETKETGLPHLHQSHGIGALVFGTDGTLLVSMGDGASYSSVDEGSASETYWQQALNDDIIRPDENVGAYRCQMLNSLNGKVLRIDPTTGDGLPSNPFYINGSPRAPESRVWALGLRNPCRMTLKPGTGSHDPTDGDPGTLYIGDVGWGSREELNVCDAPGQNFGWPKFEGMTHQPGYNNPTYAPAVHTLAKVDWRGGTGRGYVNGSIVNVGTAQFPGDNITGNCSIGGVWYDGDDFPAEYKNTYFHCDYGGDWIYNFQFDANNNPTNSQSFKTSANGMIMVATNPNDGALYYLNNVAGNSNSISNEVHKITYSPGNLPPVARGIPDQTYGASPFTVQFNGTQSYDPDGGLLTYNWDFGDGSPASNQTNPSHVYTVANGVPTAFTVNLTVTDGGGLSDSHSFQIYVNNTPPNIQSTSLDNLTTYSHTAPTNLNLSATVSDAEHNNSQLTYAWITGLYHNDHNHNEPADNNPTTSTQLDPIGCEPDAVYWYRITLIVTDPLGLSTTYIKDLYPDCSGTTQSINFPAIPNKITTDPAFNVSASASSGLPITFYLVEGPAQMTGNTVTLNGTPGSVRIRAIQPGDNTYQPAQAVEQVFDVLQDNSAGIGLDGNYFNNMDFTSPALTRIDPVINFDWGTGSPDPSMGAETFSIRWEGQIKPNYSETFTFYTTTDDGVRLWVNDQLIINQWVDQPPTEHSGTIALTANQKVDIKMEFYENGGGAMARLEWASPSQSRQTVPSANLFPTNFNEAPTAVISANPTAGAAPLNVSFDGSGSTDNDGSIVSYAWDFGDGNNGTGANTSHTYTQVGSYTATLTVTDDQGATNSISTFITVSLPDFPLQAENAVLTGVGSSWQTVNLTNTYNSPVVVATVVLANESGLPAVARVRNASGNSFEIRVQNPSDQTLSGYDVHYIVVEEGVYTVAEDGIKMEAIKAQSIQTAENNNWVLESRSYYNSYTNPVVLGQVVTANDPDWSVFWTSSDVLTNPPSSSAFSAGKHVGEDSDNTRSNEEIGYLVLETGSGTLDGVSYVAALGADIVEGINATGYIYGITGLSNPGTAILSASAMDGNNGGWPVLFGNNPLTSSAITLAFDEDQIFDTERSHTTEQVSYLVLDSGNEAPSADISVDVNNGYVPLTVNFDGSGSSDPDGSIVSYVWDFGDGNNGTGTTTSHVYGTPGTYSAKLTVTDNNGATDEATVTITVDPQENQTISFAPLPDRLTTDPPFGLSATASSGLPVSFEVVSGPATLAGTTVTLTGQTGTVIIRASQDGNVQYNAATPIEQSFEVLEPANQLPTAMFTATPLSGDAPLLVSFDGSTSSDPDGTIVSYAWDFGDGNNGTGVTTSHTYNTPGNYTASLTVTDDDGAQAVDNVIITVNDPPTGPLCFIPANGLIVIEAENYSAASPGTGAQSAFSWESYTDPQASGGVAMRVPNGSGGGWTGLNLTGPRLDYDINFTETGTYLLWVRTSGPSGNDDSFHAGLDGTGYTNSTGVGMGNVVGSWGWTNDANSGQSVEIVVNTTGLHTLNIWMREDGIQVDKIVLGINATEPQGAGPAESPQGPCDGTPNQPPVASFTASPEAGELPLDVSFDASTSSDPDGNIVSYAWDFGDGNTGTGVSTSHTYSQEGIFTAVLTVTDDEGLTNATSTNISVVPDAGNGLCFVESNGLLVMEAEDYTTSQPGFNGLETFFWETYDDNTAAGGKAVRAVPNTVGGWSGLNLNGPRLDFEINFSNPGLYYLWVRTAGPSGQDDSFHAGMDGTAYTNLSGVGMGVNGDWAWTNDANNGQSVQIPINAIGKHTFNLWMRENGTQVDKIVLKLDPAQPLGTGPQVSAMANCATNQAAPLQNPGANGQTFTLGDNTPERKDFELIVYPNPFTDEFFFELQSRNQVFEQIDVQHPRSDGQRSIQSTEGQTQCQNSIGAISDPGYVHPQNLRRRQTI